MTALPSPLPLRPAHARSLHASLAALVALSALAGVLLAANAAVNAVRTQLGRLSATEADIQSLRTRLDRAYARTDKALAMIGAAPEDLTTLSDAGIAKAHLIAACAALTNTEASCAVEESPAADGLTRYSARLSVTGAPSDVIRRALDAANSPVRLGAWSLKAAEGDAAATFEANLTLIAAAPEAAPVANPPETASPASQGAPNAP